MGADAEASILLVRRCAIFAGLPSLCQSTRLVTCHRAHDVVVDDQS
jgi:hypothetical protein